MAEHDGEGGADNSFFSMVSGVPLQQARPETEQAGSAETDEAVITYLADRVNEEQQPGQVVRDPVRQYRRQLGADAVPAQVAELGHLAPGELDLGPQLTLDLVDAGQRWTVVPQALDKAVQHAR